MRGVSSCCSKLEETVLDYLPDWPAIREAAGRLRFLDQTLAIELDRGRILDSRLVRAHGEIPELWGAQGMRIVGETEGRFSDGLRILSETPLAKDLGRLAGSLEVTGDVRLRLEIDLPFTKRRKLGVAGRLSWPKPATLAIRGTPVTLSRLGGEVTFTEKSISAEAVETMLWDRPLSLSIATLKPGVADASATLIAARARTSVTELGRRFPSPAWGLLSGEIDWDLDVTVRNRDVRAAALPLDYRLASRLNGLAIDLPAPLGKSASATLDLALVGALVPGRSLRVAGRLGDVAGNLMLDFGASPEPAMRANVRLGGESAPSPEGEGVFLDGRLADLDLVAWLARLSALSTGTQEGESTRATGRGAWFRGADLRVDRLALGGPRLTDVDLRLTPIDSGSSPKGWDVAVGAKELAGEIEIPGPDEASVRVALERLDLLALQDAPGKEVSELLGLARNRAVPRPPADRCANRAPELGRCPAGDAGASTCAPSRRVFACQASGCSGTGCSRPRVRRLGGDPGAVVAVSCRCAWSHSIRVPCSRRWIHRTGSRTHRCRRSSCWVGRADSATSSWRGRSGSWMWRWARVGCWRSSPVSGGCWDS